MLADSTNQQEAFITENACLLTTFPPHFRGLFFAQARFFPEMTQCACLYSNFSTAEEVNANLYNYTKSTLFGFF